MTPEQTTICDLIKTLGLTAAADGDDFASVTSALNAPTVTKHVGVVSMSSTLAALGPAADATIAAFEASPTGRQGLAKLAAVGLDYSHPLTTALLDAMVAASAISQATADKLTALSSPQISPAADKQLPEVTTAAAEAAWQQYRLEQRIENATALMLGRLSPDQTAAQQAATVSQAWSEA